jgi:hypothetical protein
MKFLPIFWFFFYFCGSFLPSWITIRTHNPDLGPADENPLRIWIWITAIVHLGMFQNITHILKLNFIYKSHLSKWPYEDSCREDDRGRGRRQLDQLIYSFLYNTSHELRMHCSFILQYSIIISLAIIIIRKIKTSKL